MLFQEGKLTLGKAIQLSGLTRFEFEKELAKNKIPVSVLDYDQIMADAEKLKNIWLMKIVIADTGALISLGLVGKVRLIEKVFGDFYIANAVWE